MSDENTSRSASAGAENGAELARKGAGAANHGAEAEDGAERGREPSVWLVAVRDLALVLVALTLWAAADTWYTVSGLGLAAAVSVLNGILAGGAIAGLLHEWGHFIGARVSGGTAPLAPAQGFLPLFNFDFTKSEVSHFQAMSVGGNLPTWGFALLLAWALPLDAPGRIAIVSAATGFAVFASIVEFPVMSRVAGGTPPAESLAKITSETLRRGAIGGAIAASLLATVL